MPGLLDPSRLVSSGLGRSFEGLRTGDQRRLLAGAALVFLGVLRRQRPERRLLRRIRLRPGRTVVIRLRPADGGPDREAARRAAAT
jgi:hypothetical protein